MTPDRRNALPMQKRRTQAGVISARNCMNRNSPGRPTSAW